MAQAPALTAEQNRLGRARGVLAVTLVVLGALLAPVGAVTVWARQVATDTDTYVNLVAPLAQDPAVRQAVVDRTTTALTTALNVDGLAQGAVDQLRGLGLRPPADAVIGSLQAPLAAGMTDAIRAGVRRVVTSDRFAALWREANRAAHAQLVAVLRDDPGALARLGPDGTLSLDLTPVLTAAVAALRDAGFTLVDRLPSAQASLPLLRSDALLRVQGGWRLLQTAAWAVPLAALLLIGAGVAVARRRMAALVLTGAAVAVAAGLLLLGVHLVRPVLVDHLAGVPADAGDVLVGRVTSAALVGTGSLLTAGLVLATVAVVLRSGLPDRWRGARAPAPAADE